MLDQMDYFGCIAQDEFELLSEKDQITFLLSKNVYTTINEIENVTIGKEILIAFDESTKRYIPNKIVVDHFYQFVVEHYSEFISQQFYNFNIDFNEKKYGLKKSKQYKLALQQFKHFYNQIATKAVNVVTLRNLENGGIVLENIDKLNFLRQQQKSLLSNLSKTVLLQQYLFGNKDFFVANLFTEYKILSEVIDFEAAFSIMLSLNGQYHFEKELDYLNSKQQQKDQSNDVAIRNKKNNYPEQPFENLVDESNQSSTKGKNLGAKTKKTPILSDEEAIDYLIENVFNKVKK